MGEAGDLGVIAELHYDGRGRSAPLSMFDDDIFLGARLTLNDPDSTAFLGVIIFDPDSHAKVISLEAETRLYEDIKHGELIYSSRQDDHLQVRFSRYF